ncbi:tRNA (adenosine(37)-N6)-threonylcarbamoyltransferase complex dimerization subunit type 1 TsaB [Thalassoglobus sp. JC818]|uniref:tRNA (adenosine(37)-N6)-threonylcarbamoyltransferase complex dimerization subunit type 1 TsaB n=1 Tax=Thalassoglobus sp. JC818 TaxID=3232136 RepID=UPI003459FDFF
MIVLGIETSGRSGSISLLRDGNLLGECELAATGRRHARTLIPEIGQLVSDHSLSINQIDGVAVSLGPGSFTGLRVGVVCAKTLAYSLKIPVVGIDTFAAIALATQEKDSTVWVIDDALRGDVFAGAYRIHDSLTVETLQKPHIVEAHTLRERLKSSDLLTGPGIEKTHPLFQSCRSAPESIHLPQARLIAGIGVQRLNNQDVDDCWTLKPTYLRRSAAEEKADEKKLAEK